MLEDVPWPSLRATGLRFLGSLLPLLYPHTQRTWWDVDLQVPEAGEGPRAASTELRYLLLFPLGRMHLEKISYDTYNLIKESSKRSSVCKSKIGDWFTCTASSKIYSAPNYICLCCQTVLDIHMCAC